jgi:glycosyltransferase involved in cell wall biosynthesis
VAPYGGDPWKLDSPDYSALVEAAWEIIKEQENYRKGARRRAEQVFGLDQMVQGYLQALRG